uniref:BZIP domain-containing protein n=2 Tax=Biomphalaria glabrata TaxID=6526 RepID=A0A2C9LD67_BIOGL
MYSQCVCLSRCLILQFILFILIMTTSVTTHSTSVLVSMKGSISSHASDTSCDTSPMPSHTSRSMLSSPVSMTGMSGLLNSRNLVQDEKLVVATLATLDSGNPSNLIKQDLKWIIQSRRKAEGKAELQVEFKKPVKEELTLEELTKRARRRELNRLAARRSREKGQKRKDMLVEEIRKLQTQNSELFSILGGLTEQRNRIIDTLRQHMKQCSDYQATQNAAVGMSQRVLEMLGFPISSSMHQDLPGVSSLYISTGGEHSCSPPQCSSPPVVIKDEHYSPFTSCQMSPLVVGLSGKVIQADSVAVKPSPKSSVKIEESPPVLSSCAYQTFGSSPSPQLSSSQSVSFDSPLLPAPRSAIPKRRSSMHGGEESVEDEEFFQYKHKLMKHRKQSSTDPPKVPSSETSSSSFSIRSTRVTLERSFSFPCSSSETRSNLDSPLQSSFTSDNLAVEPTATYKYYEVLPTPVPSLHTGSKSYTTDSPLDLVVKKTSETSSDFEKHFRIGQTDTWPPAGSRFGGTARGIERRWSVDDHSSFPEPLNLSKEVSTDDDGDLSQMSSFSSSSQHLSKTSSKYSSHSVDPFR